MVKNKKTAERFTVTMSFDAEEWEKLQDEKRSTDAMFPGAAMDVPMATICKGILMGRVIDNLQDRKRK
jgi:hypothetical protein